MAVFQQSYVYANEMYAQYRLDDSKSTLELGIGGSLQYNNYIDFRGIASIINDNQDDRVRINIGLVDLHIPDESLGIRIGYIQHELGFYTSQYNWAPARDIYLPPQGIYRDNFRYLVRSGKGVQIYSKHNTEYAFFELEATYSPSLVIYPQTDIVKSFNMIAEKIDENNAKVIGLSASMEIPYLKSKFRYDRQNLMFPLVSNSGSTGDMNTIGNYFGIKTDVTDKLTIISEYLVIQKYGSVWDVMDRQARLAGVDFIKHNTKAYGLSATYQYNDYVKFIAGGSAFYSNPEDKYGSILSKLTGEKPQEFYTEDLFIGVKYRRDTWISTLEYHRIKGTTTMTIKDSEGKPELNNKVIVTITKTF